MEKKNKSILVAVCILFIALFGIAIASDYCFADAQKAANEEIPPKKDYTGTLGFIPAFFDRGSLKSMVSVTQGIDNNSYLDSRRKVAGYTQMLYKTTFKSPINNKLDGILGYEIMNLMYEGGPGDLDLISNTLRAGTEFNINKDWKLSNEFKFGGVNYINTGDDNTLDYSLESKLRQNLPNKMYHSVAHETAFKAYTKNKAADGNGVTEDRKRHDLRNIYEYEIGKYLPKDMIKFKFQFYTNDSNEKFMNYYDYESYKPSWSIVHLFNDKTFGLLSYSRQYRDYRDRSLINDATVTELDVTQVLTASIYRNFTKDLTVGLSYTYRKNSSNEPTSEYSGSLFSLSASYNF